LPSDTSSSQTSLAREVRETLGVLWETEIGIPTLRGLGMEPSQKVSLPVMHLNGLNSIIFTI
jgi:hypothetical protein